MDVETIEGTAASVADQLRGQTTREAGLVILARAQALLEGDDGVRTGTQTTEFKLTALVCMIAVALVAIGTYLGDPTLQDYGAQILQYVVPGYALSRGIAKAGQGKATTDQTA